MEFVVQTFTPDGRFNTKRGHITHTELKGFKTKEVVTVFPNAKAASIAARRVEGGTAIVPKNGRSGHGTVAR